MNLSDISRLRLASQQLINPEFTSPKEVVDWMGAIQAQDFAMAKWAIGVRLPGSFDKQIEATLDKGDILRTHLLRPTWHFVPAEDIYWLLELSAPQIKASQSARDRQLELTEAVYTKSNDTIEKLLCAHGQLTREALMAELQNVGIRTDQNRGSHLFMRAELDKIICSGATLRGKPTYALLAERVPKPKILTRDEALAQLARRYFTSRCPATLQDFTWWSGLPARDAKQAMELVKPEFIPVDIHGQTYWLSQDSPTLNPNQLSVFFLPTYDEYIISYTDRRASIPRELEQHMKEISDRGVFWPIIVVNGQVTGIWRRTIKKSTMIVEIQPFYPPEPAILTLIEQAAINFSSFWGKQLDIRVGLLPA